MQLMLPETKGKKLVDIRLLFKDYTCMTGCRLYMCCCILNRARHFDGEPRRRYETRDDMIAAKRAADGIVRGAASVTMF